MLATELFIKEGKGKRQSEQIAACFEMLRSERAFGGGKV